MSKESTDKVIGPVPDGIPGEVQIAIMKTSAMLHCLAAVLIEQHGLTDEQVGGCYREAMKRAKKLLGEADEEGGSDVGDAGR